MKELTGNIWEQTTADAICITTNGTVKCDSRAVMGAGIAKQAAERYPDLPLILGDHLRKIGNHVNVMKFITRPSDNECKCPAITYLVAFPVKDVWYNKADLKLIEQSCEELVRMADRTGWTNIVLPRPGCANGKLEWKDVKPVCEKHFDDRFTIVDINGGF